MSIEASADRRVFLQRVAVGMTGLACFADTGVLRAAVTLSLREGKPVLTEAAINRMLADLRTRGPEAGRQAGKEAVADLKQFLRARFVVMPTQEAVLESLGAESRAELNAAMMQGMTPPNRLFVRIARTPSRESAPRAKGPNAGAVLIQAAVLTISQTSNTMGGTDFEALWGGCQAPSTQLVPGEPGI
jgi:hypothetical protein